MDNTIMYSKKHFDENTEGVICVDQVGENKYSFMLEKDFEKLKEISEKITFIPTTARSIAQYTRTMVSQIPKYAICTSGGVILEDGKEMEEWNTHIETLKKEKGIDFQYAINLLKNYPENTDEIKIVDDLYVYEYLHCDEEMTEGILKYLDKNLNENWLYTLQGKKLYIMPSFISKEYALDFLANKLGKEIAITAGDGKLDVGLLEVGKTKIIPEGSEVLRFLDFEYETVSKGLPGIAELFKRVEDLI